MTIDWAANDSMPCGLPFALRLQWAALVHYMDGESHSLLIHRSSHSLPIQTLAAAVQTELDIRKSRFIALLIPVPDRPSALRELDALRAAHRAATHVCWALLAGGQSGMSDDGEPSGTAGRPMMEVLRHHDLDGVLAVVVRYYGGIKLGAGGLMRAYSDAIAAAMKLAVLTEYVARAELAVEIDFADDARVRRWLEQENYVLTGSDYGMRVKLVISLPVAAVEQARESLRDLTHGRALL